MTLSKRRRIFYALIAAFIIMGSVVVLYVSGWRLDITTFKIQKVGGIFVRSFPQEAKIFLDNKAIENKSGFFGSGTLINDLFPKNYKLRLALDSYEPWEENISVSPSFVTEVSLAVLVPKKSEVVATGTPQSFWIVGDNVVVQDRGGNLVLDRKKVGRGEILSQTKDGKVILAKRSGTGEYYWIDREDGAASNVSSMLKQVGLAGNNFSVILDTESRNRLIISQNKKIFTFDPEKVRLTEIYKSKNEIGEKITPSPFLMAWTKSNTENTTSSVVVFDKFLRKVLYESPSLPGKNIDLAWIVDKKFAALQDNGELYLYDGVENTLKRIAVSVRSFVVAEDGSNLAVIGNNALEIFSMENSQGYHRFNLPEIRSVISASWYKDNAHLFVFYGDHVSFLDIGDFSLTNFVTVAKNYKKALYNSRSNGFYVLKENELEKFSFSEK